MTIIKTPTIEMKRFLLAALMMAFLMDGFSQPLQGSWSGVLTVQGFKLRLVFNLEETAHGIVSTMDSPDQNAYGIPVSEAVYNAPQLELKITPLMASFEGRLKGDSLIGTFSQAGMSFPLKLTKTTAGSLSPNRPQEPIPPFGYRTEDVRFRNTAAEIWLAGTLTLPEGKGPFPAVALISGSGAQNRDQEVFGHKPFWVLADHLTRRGFAVLRFDDRGTAASEGNFASATTADFALDALAAVAFLRQHSNIAASAVGLIGHSEGGIVAPMAAASDHNIACLVLMAGSGLPGHELLMLQSRRLSEVSGLPAESITRSLAMNRMIYDKVMKSDDSLGLAEELTEFLRDQLPHLLDTSAEGFDAETFIAGQIAQVTSPWFRYFLSHDPVVDLAKVVCPVLALNGLNDLQVPAEENLSAIKEALNRGGNHAVTLVEFPELNHLFQTSTSGLPIEYALIEETLSPVLLVTISQWLEAHLKTKIDK